MREGVFYALSWYENMDVFSPKMTQKDLNQISALGLAHVGDGVYELLTRTMLCAGGCSLAEDLHRQTVSRVNASAQARAAEKILPRLSDAERAVFKRGRNAHVNSVPHNATVWEYHAATGLETLFGWLYLQGEQARIYELFQVIMEDLD